MLWNIVELPFSLHKYSIEFEFKFCNEFSNNFGTLYMFVL